MTFPFSALFFGHSVEGQQYLIFTGCFPLPNVINLAQGARGVWVSCSGCLGMRLRLDLRIGSIRWISVDLTEFLCCFSVIFRTFLIILQLFRYSKV
jgi:hypothetical protein